MSFSYQQHRIKSPPMHSQQQSVQIKPLQMSQALHPPPVVPPVRFPRKVAPVR